jgi:opacity protein-like surface antigen
MKKVAIAFVSACMLLTAGSAAYAAAPVAEKKHEQKMHAVKKKVHAEEKKMHSKAEKSHKMHAKSKEHKKILAEKKLHAKSLKAKAITDMPKTGFGGASEQTK